VPAVIVGLKESLAGSSLNQGNYAAARRRSPTARCATCTARCAAALETIVPARRGQGARRSSGTTTRRSRSSVRTAATRRRSSPPRRHDQDLIDAGFEPDSVIAAVEAEDFSLLKHSGLYSVQLQPAGTTPRQEQRMTE
jgi:hypothetical protein